MKKKLFALILCICMCFTVFAGCSLMKTTSSLSSDTVIAKIYDKEITYADLQEKYQTYSQYFAYYDEEVVMKIIYEEMYLNAIQEIEAEKVVVLYDEDMTEIFDDLYHTFIHTVNAYEQTFIENAGLTIPSRLEEEEEDPVKFEEYVFEPAEPITFDASKKAQEPNFNEKLTELKNKVFEGIEENYKEFRTKAWNKLVADLMYSYKLDGKTFTADQAVLEYMHTQYDSLYTAKICEKYREYVESRVFGDITYEEQLVSVAMQQAIVDKYKELLNASKQGNTIEDNYTEVIFSTENTDLVLYHYEGKFEYFTVQHLLVKFDDDTVAELKKYEGYDKSKDEMFRQEYITAREEAAYKDGKWIVVTSYRDKDGNVVMTEKLDENNEIVYETDDNGEFILDENGDKIPVMVEAKISLQEIYDKFEEEWATLSEEKRQERADETGNPDYVLTNEELEYLKTNLFVQYVYMYTGDTSALGSDKLINTIGYGISSDADEDGGLMSEFADKARELYKNYKDGNAILGQEIGFAITDYGVHMMMLTGVYNKGEIVPLQKEVNGEMVDKTNEEIINDLKSVKVSTFSTQTLYEYIYDILKQDKLETYYSKHLYTIFDNAQNEGKFEIYKEPTYEDLSGR